MRSIRVLGVGLALGVVCAFAMAHDKTTSAGKPKPAASKPMPVATNAGDIQWGDAPPAFPPGAKMAVLHGNPGATGLFIVRLKVPDGYKVPAHWHPTTENLTVISGNFLLLHGDASDASQAASLTAGAFASMPARMHHSAWVKGETVVQVSAMGPFQLIYVNPDDDPRKAKK